MIINRTRNTLRNSFWGIVNKITLTVFPFLIRSCIIQFLGTEYLGLSSLFGSILSVLSLAELGFGSAIIYSMYKPIADGDENKVCALMNLYRVIYRLIGFVFLFIGLCIIPFIPVLIKGSTPNKINIYILFFIYLFQSVSSYWLFAYKNCLLVAFQRNDILSKISISMNIGMYLSQIILMFLFRNYYLYTIMIFVFSVLINLTTAIFTSKLYPQYKCKGKVTTLEIREVGKQVVGLMTQRLANTSRNSLDSIIISAYIGLVAVGIYNNYFYILNSLTALLSIFYTSMQGGIGNSVASDSSDKNYLDFHRINFLYIWISGFFSICLSVLFQPFMYFWVGENMMLPNTMAFLLSIYFFFMKLTDTIGVYVSATGLWWKCKHVYIIETCSNLLLHIVLGRLLGIAGVIIASIISVTFINLLFSIKKLTRHYFLNNSFYQIIMKDLFYTLITFLVGLVTYLLTLSIPYGKFIIDRIMWLLLRGVICLIVPNIMYIMIYRNTKQYVDSITWISTKVPKKIKKILVLLLLNGKT